MVIDFVTRWCYKSHELAQASLWGTVAQVSDVAHEPLVLGMAQHSLTCASALSHVDVMSQKIIPKKR